MLVKKLINKFSLLLFFIVVFFLTRQMPLGKYSFIMNIAVFCFFILNFSYIYRGIRSNLAFELIFCFIFILFFCSFFYSVLVRGNDIDLVIRFSIVINFILLSYFCFPQKSYINIFLWLVGSQAVFLIFFEIYMVKNFSIESYGGIREIVKSMEWGDVYTYNGSFWRIQLKGNALLPFAFFVSWIYLTSFKRYLVSALFFVSLLIAGNFAFVLGVVFFIGAYYFYLSLRSINKLLKYMFFCLVSLLFLVFFTASYVSNLIEAKSEYSNPTRIDQANVLLEDLSENPFWGGGLGNTVNVITEYRDYTDNIYFELQSIYFLNQMGLFYFMFFILFNVVFSLYFIKYPSLFLAYFSYVFYAFFNPYFFDTSHIVVILVLVSLRAFFDEKGLCGFSNLQPRCNGA